MNLLTNEFDYSLLDESTASSLQEKEYILVGIHRRYSTEVGKTFYEAQSELAGSNQYDGVFEKWFTNLGFKKQNVYNYINIYKQVQNLDEQQLEVFDKQSKSLQTEMSKPSAIPEVNQAVYNGEITTHKAYKEMEKELKQKDAEIEALKNREPEVIEKEVVKEVKVTPPDYENMRSDISQLSDALKSKQQELDATIKRNEFIENQYKEVLEDRKEDQDRKEKLEKIQTELERLAKRKNKMSDQIDTIKQLTSLKFEVDQILEKVSPFYFNQAINQIREDAVLEQSFMETVDSLQKWCDEMYNLLGKQNTFEGEIIND